MFYDISMPITHGMCFRKGTPETIVHKKWFHNDEEGDFETYVLSTPLHVATHVDIGKQHQSVPLERCIAPGRMVDVTGITTRAIEPSDFPDTIVTGETVLFKTRWDRHLGTGTYLDHPVLSKDTIKLLIEKEVNMVGIDAPGLGRGREHGDFDTMLTDNNIFVIENLSHMDIVPEETFTVYCFPLSIEGVDALPARVVIEVEG